MKNPVVAVSPLAALLDKHLEWLRVKNYSEYTVKNRRVHIGFFLDWCAQRGITEPVEITRTVLESYQRHVFHYRKKNGEPLGFTGQHARLVPLRVWFRWMARQHQGVEAGRPFEQLQDAGMRTARLDEIVRQKDAALKEVVEQLARGEVRQAIDNLQAQRRVREIVDPQERLQEIARVYAANPESTLVISPDNKSRAEINQLIHNELQSTGQLGEDHRLRVLVSRQEMTGADRQWAAQYEPGDVLRYSKGSKAMGINAGEYMRVEAMDHERNLVTVKRETGELLTYDPRRLQGVTVHRESQREFAEGDRVQFTAPSKDLRVANRELGTIEKLGEDGRMEIRMDSGRHVRFHISEHPHLDHGYAVTSHSSQGATADRVIVNVDTEQAHEKLINSRLAYVAVSRARYDAQIFTNDAKELGTELSREVSNSAAIQPKQELTNELAQAAAVSQVQQQQSRGLELSLSL